MNTKTLFSLTLLLVVPLLFSQLGCESDSDGTYWGPGENNGSVENEDGVVDAVPFSSLDFCFGGVNGSHAQYVPAEIKNLHMSAHGLSYSWGAQDLGAWGLSKDDAGALCCLFVQRADGAWVGGKFDWISTSRTTRGLENILSGYNGWTLAGVPNPCNVAFVIISKNGQKRSNVLASTWSR